MSAIKQNANEKVIVGFDTKDDAGVFEIGDGLVLVQTVDFITPVVDDPYEYGQIAAANALSDSYAMNIRPLTALNIACFNFKEFSGETLKAILSGGMDKVSEAGCTLLGGHTVEDSEIKFGLSVTGIGKKNMVVRNNTPKEGDLLILTKPLGSGIISTAIKAGVAAPYHIYEATKWMKKLNRLEALLDGRLNVNAMTDITGFGLIGHLKEMLSERFSADLHLDKIPLMEGVKGYFLDGFVPEGSYKNRHESGENTYINDEFFNTLLFDAQTSGGLLISVAENMAEPILQEAKNGGFLQAAIIGEVKQRVEAEIIGG